LPFKNLLARSFDPDSNVFLLQSDEGETRAGMCFETSPLTGANEQTISRLNSVLTTNMPKDTFIQIGLLSEPDVSFLASIYLRDKIASDGLLGEMSRRRVEMLQSGVDTPLKGMKGVHLNRQRVIISVSIPISARLDEMNGGKAEMADLGVKIKEGFSSVGFHLTEMDEGSYLALLRRFFYLYDHDDYRVDDFKETREQVFAPNTCVDFDHNEISLDNGKYFAKMLSVKHFPSTAGIGLMNMLIGDPMGSDNQITEPFWMSSTIYYPDQQSKLSTVRKKHAFLTNQAFGPMARLIPMLGYKKQGIDTLVHEIDGAGGVLCELNFTMTLFSRNKEALSGLSSNWRAWAKSFGFDMREDARILRPLFFSLLPFGQTVEGIRNLSRFHTMCVSHAVHQLPLIGNWSGSGAGGMSVLVGRRGQLALFDPFDSPTNKNGLIAAESGAGKSVWSQQMLFDTLAAGGRAWVIDQGRSYQKQCSVLGLDKAQFIEFSEDSNICLNPFSTIDDINDEMAILVSVIEKMAAPSSGFDDYARATVESKILAAYSTTGKNTTITMVAEQCLNDNDKRIQDIGAQLFPFTSRGTFGRWFDGQNNVDLSKDFVVLELQELENKKVLQQVVLLLLFSSVNHEMFLTHGRKKMLLIDEAWSLIDDPVMARAIEEMYRKARKHQGSIWLVTQNVADIYDSPRGMAIASNCAWQIIMQQKPEAVERLGKSDHVQLDPYTINMMKSIHTIPSDYSEMMIKRGDSWGVVRLITDRFSQVVYSTTGWERDLVLDRIEAGHDAKTVINELIAERG